MLCGIGGLVLCLFAAEAVHPQDAAESERAAQTVEPGEGLSGHSPAPDAQARNRALSFGFVMLGGIIVGGALLLALVVIWGNRTRRLAQSPLPPVSKRDELWFLKPNADPHAVSGDDVKTDPERGTDPGTN